MKVKDLFIYPIKSLGGIRVTSATAMEEGFQHDRRMMLVDEDSVFITQRSFPELALIGSEFTAEGFRFFVKSKPSESIIIPHDCEMGETGKVKVWKHEFQATEVKNFGQWFSTHIGMKARLMKMTSDSIRYKSLIKAPAKTRLSMADGYPYLVISEASLEDLNRRLIVSVPMDRFRPNIVVSQAKAYEEERLDKWNTGQSSLRMIKPCARCNMITIDQKTSKKLVEPLKTLSSYKKKGNKVYFGMNAVCLKEGKISIGDVISEI